MSVWSLTNPDLRNYQDYDNNFECFDDLLDGETMVVNLRCVFSGEKHLQIQIIEVMPRLKLKTTNNRDVVYLLPDSESKNAIRKMQQPFYGIADEDVDG